MELYTTGFMAQLLRTTPGQIQDALDATGQKPRWVLNELAYYDRLAFHEAKVWLAEHAEPEIRHSEPPPLRTRTR